MWYRLSSSCPKTQQERLPRREFAGGCARSPVRYFSDRNYLTHKTVLLAQTVRRNGSRFSGGVRTVSDGADVILCRERSGDTMSQSAGEKTAFQRRAGLDPAVAIHLAAARAGDQREFSGLTEPYRHELQLHCYRILGSLQDAEDIVQETLLRAWRRLETYEERAPLRAWLYKIATNACFDALAKRPRRVLPTAQTAPADPRQPFAPPITEPIWLEPYPDDLIDESAAGPEARYSLRESVSLAFLAALQGLPPRQRAVLILRDVLDWRAREAAQLLDITVSAVNSALHRARVTLQQRYHTRGREAVSGTSIEDGLRPLLERYVQVWEAADIDGLVNLLREDATLSMPPLPTWYAGREAISAAAQDEDLRRRRARPLADAASAGQSTAGVRGLSA